MAAASGRPPLSIRLLGSFAVTVEGTALRPLRTRKGEWLLALLALRNNEPVERAWLAGTLWPDSSDAQALFNLRQCLADLRRAMGAEACRVVSVSKRLTRLDLDRADCDVRDFDAAIRVGGEQALSQAVELYRGPLLPTCGEAWIVAERQRREQDYLRALETLAATSMQRADPRRAVEYLRRAVATDPLWESAQRLLMEALAADGDRAAALQVYRELRSHLYRELNAEPDPVTTALYRRLRCEPSPVERPPVDAVARAAAPIRPAARSTMPKPLTSLVGRERETAEIGTMVASSRLLTLVGSGGVGKTRLAIQVAGDIAGDFEDGAGFVDLSVVSDGALIAAAVCAALGVREAAETQAADSLVAFLTGRDMLLVLDNCEHVVDGCARLARAVLESCEGVRILATSREPLNVDGERVWRVPSLEAPDEELIEQSEARVTSAVAEYDAVRLFVERATQHQSDFSLTPQNARAVARLCRRLDGIPLAIELAAARVRAASVEQIDARLGDCLALLNGGPRGAAPRHRTLRALFDWSFGLLTDVERSLLCRLSVFAGGWTLEAAESVCADELLESGRVVDALTALVDKSLVSYDARTDPPRYSLLETTRQYGREALARRGEDDLWRDRHADWFVRLAEIARTHYDRPDEATWLDRLEADDDNLRAALDWLLDARRSAADDRALRLAGVLARFWYVRGRLREGSARLEQALRGSSLRTSARAAALIGLERLVAGAAAFSRRDELLAEALAIAIDVGDRTVQARAMYCRGGLAMEMRDHEAAHARLLDVLPLFEQIGDSRGISATYNALGRVAFNRGRYSEAQVTLEKALSVARAAGDLAATLGPLNNLGLVAFARGDVAEAVRHHETCLAGNRELNNRPGIAWSLANLAECALAAGEPARARRLQEEGLRRCVDLDHDTGLAEAVRTMALIAAAEGDSREHAARAARLFGGAAALRAARGARITEYNVPYHERVVADVRERLDACEFDAATVAGAAMPRDALVAYALNDGPPAV